MKDLYGIPVLILDSLCDTISKPIPVVCKNVEKPDTLETPILIPKTSVPEYVETPTLVPLELPTPNHENPKPETPSNTLF